MVPKNLIGIQLELARVVAEECTKIKRAEAFRRYAFLERRQGRHGNLRARRDIFERKARVMARTLQLVDHDLIR